MAGPSGASYNKTAAGWANPPYQKSEIAYANPLRHSKQTGDSVSPRDFSAA